ncbi:MAG TPA: methylthioribulose 1-phosphate dehydratase [Nitrospira sp.]|nr:methylthioribulose 1-phosphate dehydratase [Nitrospira sp.]
MDTFRDFKVYADDLAETARWAHRNGWAPATSTNYSVRLPPEAAPAICAITASGVDKGTIDAGDIVAVDGAGLAVGCPDLRPSAETPLHLMLYRTTDAGAVLHTHSLAAALLSRTEMPEGGRLILSGWELLKGLGGITTHEQDVVLPIFPNSQDIPKLATVIEAHLTVAAACYGFLLAGHGIYVWGKDLRTAKRHLEVFEFILQCEREVRNHGRSSRTR